MQEQFDQDDEVTADQLGFTPPGISAQQRGQRAAGATGQPESSSLDNVSSLLTDKPKATTQRQAQANQHQILQNRRLKESTQKYQNDRSRRKNEGVEDQR